MNNKDVNLKLNISDEAKKTKHIFKHFKPRQGNGFSWSLPEFSETDTNELTLEEIHKLYPPFQSSTVNTCVVFWDDIVQFTTLGALDLFNELILKEDDFDLLVDEFFNRKNSLIESEKFIYAALNQVYTLTQIERFYKKFYEVILNNSPFSGILPSLGSSIQMLNRVIFVFKHEVSSTFKTKLKEDLYKYWDITGRNKIIEIYSINEIKNEEEFYKHCPPSAVFTPNGADTLTALIKNDLKHVDVFVNAIHNGLSAEFFDIYVYKLDMISGPNQNKIYFYDDQIHVEDPQIFNEYQRSERT